MRHAGSRGFTALELMIVITIIGLALAASWGNIRDFMRQQRLIGATNVVVTQLRLAREKAVAEGNNYIVTFRPGPNDIQVWDDEGSDAILGPQDSRRNIPMPDETMVRNPAFFGSNRLTFRPDGTCDASGSVEVQIPRVRRRINVLASTGKITVTTP